MEWFISGRIGRLKSWSLFNVCMQTLLAQTLCFICTCPVDCIHFQFDRGTGGGGGGGGGPKWREKIRLMIANAVMNSLFQPLLLFLEPLLLQKAAWGHVLL